MKGDDFNFEWKGLTEGFKSTLEEFPEIAKRATSDIEKALGERIGKIDLKRPESDIEKELGEDILKIRTKLNDAFITKQSAFFDKRKKAREKEKEQEKKDAVSGPIPLVAPKPPPTKGVGDFKPRSLPPGAKGQVGGRKSDVKRASFVGLTEAWRSLSAGGVGVAEEKTAKATADTAKNTKNMLAEQKMQGARNDAMLNLIAERGTVVT